MTERLLRSSCSQLPVHLSQNTIDRPLFMSEFAPPRQRLLLAALCSISTCIGWIFLATIYGRNLSAERFLVFAAGLILLWVCYIGGLIFTVRRYGFNSQEAVERMPIRSLAPARVWFIFILSELLLVGASSSGLIINITLIIAQISMIVYSLKAFIVVLTIRYK